MAGMAGTKKIPNTYDVASLRKHLAAVEAMIPRTRELLEKAASRKGKSLDGLLGGFDRAERAMIAARAGIQAICDQIDAADGVVENSPKNRKG